MLLEMNFIDVHSVSLSDSLGKFSAWIFAIRLSRSASAPVQGSTPVLPRTQRCDRCPNSVTFTAVHVSPAG